MIFLALGAALLQLASKDTYAPDTPEPGSIEAIRAATTDPRYLSTWVSYLPHSPQVPSPMQYLGRIAGAPGELAGTEKTYGYFRKLAETSRRVALFPIGKSEEGRDILLLAVSDEEGIAAIDRLKQATASLADPRLTSPEAAETLVAAARPIYYFNAGLHSDESGSTEASLELAYRLAVSEQPMIQEIRAKVLVLINPISNPDGRDKVVDWFYRFLKGKTDYEKLPRQSPPYWSKYAMVDINRDSHQQTHATTRAVHRMFREFHPTVIHDLHEGTPLLLTWSGTGPFNPHLDPITVAEVVQFGLYEVEALTALGMPGVSTWNFGEGFGLHYLDSIAMNHNSLGRGYETFGNQTAETVHRLNEPSEVTREWYRPLPPSREVTWSMRDNLNYTETAALAALDYTARHGRELLRAFYKKGWNSWRLGVEQPPYAFVIPAEQGDRLRVAQLVGRLLDQRIEVHKTPALLELKEGHFPAGSYVVRLDQPYRNYAVDLLTPQEFPKDSPQEPYDDISWALTAHYKVEAVPIADPLIRREALDALKEAPHPTGRVAGVGPVFLLKDTGQESLFAARYRLAGFRVDVAERGFRAGNSDFPAGSWVIPPQEGLRDAINKVAAELALDFESAASPPSVPTHACPAPRVGVWVPWADTDSIGWVRYALDQRSVPYLYVRDEDIRKGDVLSGLDVLLYGHVDLELAEQIHGIPKAWGPMPYKKTPQTPSHGTPAESEDITGGIGWGGLARLQRFVEEGGVLVTLGSGSALALEGGLARGVRRTSGGVPRSVAGGGTSAQASASSTVRTPGSHLRVTFPRPDHPIAYGYPKRSWVFRQNFPLYDTPRRWLRMAYCTSCLDGPEDPSGVVMEWGDREGAPFVVSGGAWGEAQLVGRPAILDLPVGRGHLVAFNFNPLHRDLNRGDHRLVWNAILNFRAILEGR